MLMLKELLDTAPAPPTYSGYPEWIGWLVSPGREHKAAERLLDLKIYVYLASFTCQRRTIGSKFRAVERPVFPGLIFVPVEFTRRDRLPEIFELCHVRGFLPSMSGAPAIIAKSDIEIVRDIEAKLNIPPPAPEERIFRSGDEVRFVNGIYATFLGTGSVVEVVSQTRIGVRLAKLFGASRVVYVPASEIEAM